MNILNWIFKEYVTETRDDDGKVTSIAINIKLIDGADFQIKSVINKTKTDFNDSTLYRTREEYIYNTVVAEESFTYDIPSDDQTTATWHNYEAPHDITNDDEFQAKSEKWATDYRQTSNYIDIIARLTGIKDNYNG